jgi:hypothetical protein
MSLSLLILLACEGGGASGRDAEPQAGRGGAGGMTAAGSSTAGSELDGGEPGSTGGSGGLAGGEPRGGAGGAPRTGTLAGLIDNDWVRLPTTVAASAVASGSYQTRGWCTLRFVPGRDTLFFYEGFQEDSRGNYCIYANSLYEVDPTDGDVQHRTLSNWFCDDSGGYHRLDGLPDTPVDRHTYAQFAYAPTTDRLYMLGGAAGRFAVADWPYDFWSYSFDEGAWELLPESYPGAESDRAAQRGAYTANLIFHPPSNSLLYFQAPSAVHRFSLDSGAWSTFDDVTGADAVTDIGAHGLYDPVRDRFAFYGNNWHPSDEGTTELTFFDAEGRTWSRGTVPSAPNGPPAKSYASLEYDDAHDVYLLHGGWKQNDTWAYRPADDSWLQIATSTAPPPAGTGTYVAYDSTHGALIRLDESEPALYALRYVPEP